MTALDWISITILRRAAVSRTLAILITGLLLAGIAGCAAGPAPTNAPPPVDSSLAFQAAAAPRQPLDFSGVWDGQSRASCTQFNPFAINTRCNAINKIAITIVQEDGKITGFYKCSVGNMDCRDQNDSGTISNGSIKNGRLALRIGMLDGSSCIFNGAPAGANQVQGSYTCYQGGGLVEQGSFQIARGY